MIRIAAATGAVVLGGALLAMRARSRARRRYLRLCVLPYRTDRASVQSTVAMFETLHKRLLRRQGARLLLGQPSLAVEVHLEREAGVERAWLGVVVPAGSAGMVQAALRAAYPNVRLLPLERPVAAPRWILAMRKRRDLVLRVRSLARLEDERAPVDRLIAAMAASGANHAVVQLALAPAPPWFESLAQMLLRSRERRLYRTGPVFGRDGHRPGSHSPPAQVDQLGIRGALELQHRALFYADVRIGAESPGACRWIASELRSDGAENELVARTGALLLRPPHRRVRQLLRGEASALPDLGRGVLASTELAALWHLPSVEFAAVPFARTAVPVAPAPPAIMRPGGADPPGALRDALGPVSIAPALRRQNVAVPGAVGQGKSSYLVGTIAEDLARERCAIVVLDPKGDAADAAISLVPDDRVCTLLDFAHPTCGFNPLGASAPADVVADYVVGALRNLFSEGDIRASSDRYLRNAIIAVLAHDGRATLWDAARLLSVGEEGYAYRTRVGARVRGLPELKEITQFFTAELTAQLADARATTTAKLDAPVNKLARLLNSASIKRVLLNRSLELDLERVIAGGEVLVVKGALGSMGAGNTAVLMQLILGMLDAALARQQDFVPADERISVALKVDEAPLVINRGFAETLALKRSAGLETVACWQSDAQWEERELRDQLPALFAHRVYFATAAPLEARAAASLMMAEFSDQVRAADDNLSRVARPDVRLHLPRNFAIASWTTHAGRQPPFIARTSPLRVDAGRIARHASRQAERGGRYLEDLRQPHWDEADTAGASRLDADHRGAAGMPAPVTPAAEITPPPAGSSASTAPDGAAPAGGGGGVNRGPAAESYRELVALDRARSVRFGAPPARPTVLSPDELDLAILTWLARVGHALTSQVHRRFNSGRATTTTQRRLKRLADAGCIRRVQLYRDDGGGLPMCCAVTASGFALVEGHRQAPPGWAWRELAADDGDAVRAIRRDVHVTGWLVAAAACGGVREAGLRGRAESVRSPRSRGRSDGGAGVWCPSDLRLPGGRTPHDFLVTGTDGQRAPAARFETIRPDAALRLVLGEGGESPPARSGAEGDGSAELDVLVDLDLRPAQALGAGRWERYDHFLSGWQLLAREGARRPSPPLIVVLVHRDEATAREAARRADAVVVAARAYAGDYPANWEYVGRRGLLFAAERDVHQGRLRGLALPPLPPEVRVEVADGDPQARECALRWRSIAAA